ncbi:MAG: UvrD-helicase domain-containing protein [Schleiferiaceae bacterium]|nr:UvrD-helicase domain-containing protein [Schleiferiaceae bacterium]MDP4750069.1 UvrD-helicase domain-containing protein [Schleiferiaceae bacterium]
MNDLRAGLNPPQLEAVEHTEGPVMVIAGAGSGKTRVLTVRIAHLLEKGVDPFHVLALTFTNKAAREMQGRIAKLVDASSAKSLWVGTFHSVFARILRSEAGRLGFPSNFTIYDTEDAQKVLAGLIKEAQLDKDIYKVKAVASRISQYKNALITPKAYDQRGDLQEQDAAARLPQLGNLYRAYMEKCFRAGAMDFDDLLLKTNELFVRFPEALAKYQERFKYILVDEYQDTNHSQYLIVKVLASRYENLCVVGDDAQSIYAFRGANIRNILNFRSDYPDAAEIRLEQNYRSTKNIVGAANSLIAHNQEQLEKNVWTANAEGDLIVVHKAMSDTDEAHYVAQTMWDRHMHERRNWDQFAILYRTNAQSRSFEEAFRRRNIPYTIYGGTSFYQRKEIKDVMAYVRLALNPNDEEALRRIINLPTRGIGDTTLTRLTVVASEQSLSLWGALNLLPSLDMGINRPTVQKLVDFADLIRSFGVVASQKNAFDAVDHIAKHSGLVRTLAEDKTPEGISRYENVQELLNGIQEFVEEQEQVEGGNPSLDAFAQDIALLTDVDTKKQDDQPKVTLMTIHLAKGLEFPVVFVVGLEETLFPSLMASQSRSDLEEERRLFYVALTRAEHAAYLTYAHVRFRWGKLVDCEPSRFLDELDEKYLNVHIPVVAPSYRAPQVLLDAFDAPTSAIRAGEKHQRSNATGSTPGGPRDLRKAPTPKPSSTPTPLSMAAPGRFKPVESVQSGGQAPLDLTAGERVLHERFGAGTVTEISGETGDLRATVHFDNAGVKKLLLKFAKLQRLI